MKRAILHVLVLAFLAAAVVGGVLLWQQRPWRVSVSVNGRVLTARELDMRAQLLLEDARRMRQMPASLEDYRRQAAARWIVKEVFLSEAVARGFEVNPNDEKDALAKLEKDLTTHNMTVEQYFKHMPLPEEAMRRDFREVLLVQKFLKRDVEEKISLTTEEIESSMKALRSRAFLKEALGEKTPKVARKKVTDMLRATRLNKGYQDMLRSLCAKAEISIPDYPEIADVERYVIPWCPRSRQQALPEGVAPERAAK